VVEDGELLPDQRKVARSRRRMTTLRKAHVAVLTIVAALAILSMFACAASADGFPHPNRLDYTREMFTGSYPCINGTVELIVFERRVLGDHITVDENNIYVPAAQPLRFHVTSLDSNYVVRIKNLGNKELLLEVAVSGNGEGSGALARPLGLKEVRELQVLKNGEDLMGHGVKVVPLG
jgi:hypothetical protein